MTTFYYAIDDNQLYHSMAKRSIASLRRFLPKADIQIELFGVERPELTSWCEKAEVRLTYHKLPRTLQKTFLKWVALEAIDAEQVVFVDADTVFYGDVTHLLNRYSERSFYAREELNTTPGKTAFIGGKQFPQQIDHEALANMFTSLKRRATPIFNTGVMIFNRGSHRLIIEHTVEILRWERDFREHRQPYPSKNSHIADEIAAALVIGGIEGVTTGLLAAEDAPFFVEVRDRVVPGPGLVMHIFSFHYDEFLHACVFGEFPPWSQGPSSDLIV